MLNLNYNITYQYSASEKKQLKKIKSKYGRKYQKVYGASKKRVWYDGEVKSLKIKNKIITSLLNGSRFRCSYCTKRLTRSEKPIDHFIPNSDYPFFSFHPLNLIPSCGYCNSSLKKTFDPLVIKENKYSRNKFCMVHPIIDNVDEHIAFRNADRTILDIPNCSIEGLTSIQIFELHTLEMLDERINQHLINTHNPLTDDSLTKLVNECATYKTKA